MTVHMHPGIRMKVQTTICSETLRESCKSWKIFKVNSCTLVVVQSSLFKYIFSQRMTAVLSFCHFVMHLGITHQPRDNLTVRNRGRARAAKMIEEINLYIYNYIYGAKLEHFLKSLPLKTVAFPKALKHPI